MCSQKSVADARRSFLDRRRPPEHRCATPGPGPNGPPSRRHQRKRDAAALESPEVERNESEADLSAGASQLAAQWIARHALEHFGRDFNAHDRVVPARAGRPDVMLAQKFLDGFDLSQSLGRHLDPDRYSARQAWG